MKKKFIRFYSLFLWTLSLLMILGVLHARFVSANELTNYTVNTTFEINKNEVIDGASYGDGKFYIMPTYTFPDEVVLKNGDAVVYTIPKQFQFASVIEGEVKTADGTIIAKVSFDEDTNKVTTTVTDQDYFLRLTSKKMLTPAITVTWDNSVLYNVPQKIELEGYKGVTLKRVKVDEEPLGVSKWGTQDKKDPSIVNWRVRVNRDIISPTAGSNVNITDTIPENQELVRDGMFVRYFSHWDEDPKLQGITAFDISKLSVNGNTIQIPAGDLTSKGMYIGYKTRIIGEIDKANSKVYNDVTVNSDGKSVSVQAFAPITQVNGTGSAVISDEIVFSAKKILNGRSIKNGEFRFQLIDEASGAVEQTTTADSLGNIIFQKKKFTTLGTFKYQIKEVNTGLRGVAYDSSILKATVVVEEQNGTRIAKVTYDQPNFSFTNTFSEEKIVVRVQKIWEDNNNQDGKRPDKVVARLFANGQEIAHQDVVDISGKWETNFVVNKYDDNDQEIIYTVTEDTVEDYTSEIRGDVMNGFTITNHHIPATTEVSGVKTWQDGDNQDGKRPDKISVYLLKNGQKVATTETSADSNWEYHFSNLPQYETGQKIDYTIDEESVAGYTTVVNQYNLLNSRVPETIDLTVNKHWNDVNNQDGKRPKEITVHLLADGIKVDSQKVSSDVNGKWSTSFLGKPKYKAGKEISYTITEEAVEEYTQVIKDFEITNSYSPKVIDYAVTKIWNDANNQDGKRPDKIMVHLFKNINGIATEIASQEITEKNNWQHIFINLPQYESGNLITYSVTEDEVEGYETSVNGQEITNTHISETIRISGRKLWDDVNNQDGKRPDKIMVTVKNGSTVVDTIEAQADSNSMWNFISKDLPKYENGREILYTVEEATTIGYERPIIVEDATQKGQFTITNKRTPEKISIGGKKIWNDVNNQDGIRPETIVINLYANGEKIATTATNEILNWTYKFENLSRYQDGKEISYEVKEENVAGYQSEINGYNVVNTHVPETITITGKKIWEDNNNQDDIRPKSTVIHLLADGKEVSSTTVRNDGDSQFTFANLPLNYNGKKIQYALAVDKIAGYITEINEFTITSIHQPESKMSSINYFNNNEKEKSEVEKANYQKSLPRTSSVISFSIILAGFILLLGGFFLVKSRF